MSSNSARWTAPWRNLRWVFVWVWILFLAYPASSVATSNHSQGLRILGFALLAAFALVYLVASVYVLSGPPEVNPRAIGFFAVLGALACGLLPIIGTNAFGTGPFLIVVAAFTFPLV